MPYADPEINKQKARERKRLWMQRRRQERIAAGLPADGRGHHHNGPKGSTHHRWNNEDLRNKGGYKLVRVGISHPLSDPNGYAPEHHVVWVSAGNSAPSGGLIIHHLNGDKLDNRLENLSCITIEEHNHIHNIEKGRNDKGQFISRNKSGHLLDGQEHRELPR